MKKLFFRLAVVAVGIVLISAAGNKYFEISKNLEVYSNVYKHLNTYYVDDLDPKDLVEASIDAMLEKLDPYNDYIPSEELEDFRFQNTGKYGGIGATIQKREDFVTVVAPYKNSPADKAGLRAGDKFFSIDGKSAKGLESDEVVSQLKGDPNTDVTVIIDRNGEQFETTITRKIIKVPNVPYYGMQGNVAYIKLAGFTEGAGDEVRNALEELKQNHQVEGIVLDLKGNGGGLLHEAIAVSNVFVPKGEIVVSTKGKVKNTNREYKTPREAADTTTPLAVLIDGGTASASEIVSGTIQDLDRGVIIGQTSFGKGLVQSTRPVAYNSQLKLTTSKYY
nr:S41 family peptidase [Saprospiraceae bacterium]